MKFKRQRRLDKLLTAADVYDVLQGRVTYKELSKRTGWSARTIKKYIVDQTDHPITLLTDYLNN